MREDSGGLYRASAFPCRRWFSYTTPKCKPRFQTTPTEKLTKISKELCATEHPWFEAGWTYQTPDDSEHASGPERCCVWINSIHQHNCSYEMLPQSLCQTPDSWLISHCWLQHPTASLSIIYKAASQAIQGVWFPIRFLCQKLLVQVQTVSSHHDRTRLPNHSKVSTAVSIWTASRTYCHESKGSSMQSKCSFKRNTCLRLAEINSVRYEDLSSSGIQLHAVSGLFWTCTWSS